MALALELGSRMNYDPNSVSQVSKVCKDNMGTHNLTNSKGPLMTSRTNHILIKHHLFLLKIQPTSIDILHISTKQ